MWRWPPRNCVVAGAVDSSSAGRRTPLAARLLSSSDIVLGVDFPFGRSRQTPPHSNPFPFFFLLTTLKKKMASELKFGLKFIPMIAGRWLDKAGRDWINMIGLCRARLAQASHLSILFRWIDFVDRLISFLSVLARFATIDRPTLFRPIERCLQHDNYELDRTFALG